MRGEFWESYSYFGTELSVGLDPLLFKHFFFYFSDLKKMGHSFVANAMHN